MRSLVNIPLCMSIHHLSLLIIHVSICLAVCAPDSRDSTSFCATGVTRTTTMLHHAEVKMGEWEDLL